jgi:hypothetical protein
VAFAISCDNSQNRVLEEPVVGPTVLTHVPNNQVLRPVVDSSPQAWFSVPENLFNQNPKVTYQTIDEPVPQNSWYDYIHACQCPNGLCQTHQYKFSDYSGTGQVEVHDINIYLHVSMCKDAYNYCGGQTAVVWVEVSYYISGILQDTEMIEHFGPTDCNASLVQLQFSDLSLNRQQINSLEVRVKIGGQPFCQNSTLASVGSIEAECVAGEVHGGGGCHCDPSG